MLDEQLTIAPPCQVLWKLSINAVAIILASVYVEITVAKWLDLLSQGFGFEFPQLTASFTMTRINIVD